MKVRLEKEGQSTYTNAVQQSEQSGYGGYPTTVTHGPCTLCWNCQGWGPP